MIPSLDNGWTRHSWAMLRVGLGIYLMWHWLALWPHASELFSSTGMLPDASTSPLRHAFPNVLVLCDAPWACMVLLGMGLVASVTLIAGVGDRAGAVVSWYVLACFLGRNPLITNPSLPYVGLVLLVHAMAGPGRRRGARPWRLSGSVYWALWVVMAVGYSYSGITKLVSPSWADGTAIIAVLHNPLARPNTLRELMLALSPALTTAMTWGVLVLEIGFAPLALVRRLRPWLWVSMVLMHIGLIVLVDFADLSLGMVIVHAATFDPAWGRRWVQCVRGRWACREPNARGLCR
ncbi:MAG: hypothetical protein K0V04_03140 [Deltaproteobacteria bacterium]|nr:hypothetical protein [Deltaproteobacteria bacterium]